MEHVYLRSLGKESQNFSRQRRPDELVERRELLFVAGYAGCELRTNPFDVGIVFERKLNPDAYTLALVVEIIEMCETYSVPFRLRKTLIAQLFVARELRR